MLDTAASPSLTASPDFDEVPLALLEGEVSRIVRSRPFRQSARHQRFLRRLVRQAAACNAAALKESVLACEVFELVRRLKRARALQPA